MFKDYNRLFGFVISFFFITIFLIYEFYYNEKNIVFCYFAIIFVFLSFLTPSIFKYPRLIWESFGKLMHKISNPIILTFIFYICLTPLGFILKLINVLSFNKKTDPLKQTYWVNRNKNEPSSDSFNDQF